MGHRVRTEERRYGVPGGGAGRERDGTPAPRRAPRREEEGVRGEGGGETGPPPSEADRRIHLRVRPDRGEVPARGRPIRAAGRAGVLPDGDRPRGDRREPEHGPDSGSFGPRGTERRKMPAADANDRAR